ncbi:hemagglutinin/amebocyte aggregation factor [Pocillopora verrucosa]|uniref:hemagglutinin/amebocyte aggregation factor n=1 Tax=Pocillopora verrucosa TaxID=203993 RepID=UPI00333FB210
MARKTTAKLLLLLMTTDVLLISFIQSTPWWSRRRRCKSSKPLIRGVIWVNSWHHDFSTVYCKKSFSLRKWYSRHRTCKKDRIFSFACGYGPVTYNRKDCVGKNHLVNNYDKPVDFECKRNSFIIGVGSEYSHRHADRRFKFLCCPARGFVAHSCKTTKYQNEWKGDLDYLVPSGYFLVGVYSKHNNSHEDRRWKFDICKFSKKRG